jgi:hypothetical protein
VIVLELRVPVSAATFRCQVQHQPKRVEAWGTARILSGVGHLTAHLSTVEAVNRSITAGENIEARYVGVAGIDVGACVIAGHVGDKREVRERAVFLTFHQPLDGRARRNGDCGPLAQIDSDAIPGAQKRCAWDPALCALDRTSCCKPSVCLYCRTGWRSEWDQFRRRPRSRCGTSPSSGSARRWAAT